MIIEIPYGAITVLRGIPLREAGTAEIKTTATLAAGDVKVEKDGGGLADMGTLPSEDTAASGMLAVTISATESACKVLAIRFIDQTATKQWEDNILICHTTGHASAFYPNRDIAMRGTDSAALASVCTEPRLAELDAANLPTDVAAIPTTAMRGTDSAALATTAANIETDTQDIQTKIGTPVALDSGAATLGGMLTQMADDNGGADFAVATDSLEAIAAGGGGGGLTSQQTRDAMKLAPTAGAPSAGSVDEHLDDILADTNEIQSNDVTIANIERLIRILFRLNSGLRVP